MGWVERAEEAVDKARENKRKKAYFQDEKLAVHVSWLIGEVVPPQYGSDHVRIQSGNAVFMFRFADGESDALVIDRTCPVCLVGFPTPIATLADIGNILRLQAVEHPSCKGKPVG